MLDLILKGGRIIDPANGRDEVADIGFGDGRVAALGSGLPLRGSEIVDARGLIVVPGLIDTVRAPGTKPPQHHQSSKTLVGRFGTSQDIAAAVRFLAGPEARYITGQSLHVNGGAYLG